MKVKKELLIFAALMLLLMGVVCATDVSDDATGTVSMAEDAVQETQTATDMNNIVTQENEEKNVERDTSPENDANATHNIQKKANKANTKEDTSVTTWEQLKQTIEDATEDTTITLGDNLINEERIIVNNGRIITINGNGKTINGAQNQVFYIKSGTTLILKNITITNAIYEYGGAISNNGGTLNITHSTLINNTATHSGGAILNTGTLTITHTTLQNNTANTNGGAIINSRGTLTITDSTLANNTANNYGGAIDSIGRMNFIHSTLANNTAEYGGAIYDSMGLLNITDSTLANNSANCEGGAIYTSYFSNCIITNTNLTKNRANYYGGAIENWGELTITYSTLANNTAKEVGGAIFNSKSSEDVNFNVTETIFIQNHAGSAGAICSDNNTITNIIINNTFTGNTADDNETLVIFGVNNIERNIYDSTDISFKTINLTVNDNQETFETGEDVTLNFIIELEHQEYYDMDILEKLNKTIYINGEENVTTTSDVHTLSNLKVGTYSIIYTSCNQQSNTLTFKIIEVSEITTQKTDYDYYGGVQNTVTLDITDPRGEKGRVDISVKDGDEYQELISFHNVKDGYTFTTEILNDALKNLYSNDLENYYLINVTYISNDYYVAPSSTEFTLNIIKQRNTSIIYDIVNNTEGNVQIYIIVLDDIYRTPVPDAAIKITGDIQQETTIGIITDTTLSPGDYTITVSYEENADYKASSATIDFTVEIDKNEKIEELEEQVENLNIIIQEQSNTINTLNDTINDLNNTVQEQSSTINELNDTIQTQNLTIQDLQEQIDELKAPKETTLTIDEITDVKYGDEITITGTLVNEDDLSISNQNITIKFNDEETTVTTRNGEFKYTTTAAIIGENILTAAYAGNNKNKESGATYTFEVAKAYTAITITPIEAVKKGETVTVTGTLVDHNGNKLANSVVRLLINNGRKTLRTDADGVYTFDYTLTRIGENTITATYEGSDYYSEATESIAVEVKPYATTIVIDPMDPVTKGTKASITGTLTDENGDAVVNALVKLSINGSQKTLTTDSEGKFTHNYTMGKLGENTITAEFAGNANYEAAETATTVEVTKAESVITLVSVESDVKGSNVTFTGKLTDVKGVAIANAQVKIMINGSPKTLKTDANGVFSHTFKMTKEGTNNITAIFNGNKDYNACETTTSLLILKVD